MRRFWKGLIALPILVVIGSIAADLLPLPIAGRANPTAAEVNWSIDLFGSNATIDALEGPPYGWDHVMAHIASGDAAWLKLAPRLVETGNAHASEELHDHFGLALAHSPALVLAITAADRTGLLETRFVCEAGYMNNLEHGAPAGFKEQAVAGVQAIRDPKLASARKTCLAELNRDASQCSNGGCPPL